MTRALALAAAAWLAAFPACAQALHGDPAAVELARKMIGRLGGAALWGRARTLHVEERSYHAQSERPEHDAYVRDLRRPRIRGDYEDGVMVLTPAASWRSTRGKVEPWPAERSRRFAEGWGGNIYVLYHRLAAGDPALALHTMSERRFEVLEGGRRIGWFETTMAGSPVRWARFAPGEPDRPAEEWIYGPLRDFGPVRFPAWGVRLDGDHRFYYTAVRLSEQDAPADRFPPRP